MNLAMESEHPLVIDACKKLDLAVRLVHAEQYESARRMVNLNCVFTSLEDLPG